MLCVLSSATSVLRQQPAARCLLLPLLTLLLLLTDSCSRVQGHGQHTSGGHDEGHSDHGLGDFSDDSEISNPLRHSDFIKHKE